MRAMRGVLIGLTLVLAPAGVVAAELAGNSTGAADGRLRRHGNEPIAEKPLTANRESARIVGMLDRATPGWLFASGFCVSGVSK